MNELQSGHGFPIGATVTEDGVNFCLISKNAKGVDLLLFDNPGDMLWHKNGSLSGVLLTKVIPIQIEKIEISLR